jgi:Pvc16 N-terminal domain
MSNALGISAVTESLVQFLSNAIVKPSQVPDAWVSSVTPDQTAGLANPGVNVFLYQVSPNAAYRNADLPTRAADGKTLLRKPQLALNLHYLLTFYGDESALAPQRLLGATALALHAFPNLQRTDVQNAPIEPLSSAHHLKGSADSGLAVQSQLIRFTPVTYTLEELSKLWSFLLKVDYVLSAAYVASVLLIQTDDPTPGDAPPALSFGLRVLPFRQPTITSVLNAANASAPIGANAQIAINGTYLASATGGATLALINGEPVAPTLIAPNRIVLTIPGDLAAGTATVQVMQPLSLGAPATPHPGTGAISGAFPFTLVPAIAPGAGSIQIIDPFGSPPGRGLAVKVLPTVKTGQHVLLLLSQASPQFTRLVDGGVLSAPGDTLTFALPAIPIGTYLVQVMVDGALSALTTTGGVPTGPTVNL